MRTISLFPIPILAVTATACALGPYDMDEVRSLTESKVFAGYTIDPGVVVAVQALNQATNAWTTIGSATASSTVSINPNVWHDNPALYRWQVSAAISNPCFYNASCIAPTGDYGVSTVRVRFQQQGSGSQLIVFHEDWSPCMGDQFAHGAQFLVAAYNCRSWSYPEMRLRLVGEWWGLEPRPASSPPAFGAVAGNLSIATSNGSTIEVSRNMTQGSVGAWTSLGGAPPGGIAADVAPAIAQTPDETFLRMFVRGSNGALVAASGGGTWSGLSTVPGVTQLVAGRISAALGSTSVSHVVNPGPTGMVSYWRITGAGQSTTHVDRFPGLDGVVGSRGADHAVVVVRTPSGLQIWSFAEWLGWTPALVATLAVGAIDDVSEVVYYGGKYHVVYARPLSGGSGEIVHVATNGTTTNDAQSRQVGYYATAAAPASVAIAVSHSRGLSATGALAVVHGHLVAAWRDATPGVQTARWDRSSSAAPWLREPTVGGTTALVGRPVLAGAAMALPLNQAQPPGFGNDVFVAARGADQRVRFANLTRGMMRRDVAHYFELFDYPLNALCSIDSGQTATFLEDLAVHDRPFISELGALQWTLPAWFVDEVFLASGKAQCERGDRQIQATETGRPCGMEKQAVVIKPVGPLYVCPDGPYVNYDSSITGTWEEVGHTMSGAMGFHDSAVGPTSADALVTDISLPALQAGYALFGQSLGGCGDLPRCPGFTRLYDTTSRQHSFIYAMYAYMFSGTTLRAWIQQDLTRQPCNDLLARKYLWIRTNFFPGVEFDDRGEPLLAPSTIPTCTP
jgi:hypothetical protein